MGVCGKILKFLLPVAVAYFIFRGDNFDPESIRGKRVLVTGASSGIGARVAYQYAQLGANLVITARRAELLEKVQQKCVELGAESVISVPADMTMPQDRAKVVGETLKALNGLDILILNHAWIKFQWWKNTVDDFKLLQDSMNINFYSYVDITSQLASALNESNGYIGVVSALGGKMGFPRATFLSANKHAIHGFYSALRQELRAKSSNVSVTIIVYGLVASENLIEVVNADNPSFDYNKIAGSCEDAADALIRGVSAREYEVNFPAFATIFKYALRLFPYFLEDISAANVVE